MCGAMTLAMHVPLSLKRRRALRGPLLRWLNVLDVLTDAAPFCGSASGRVWP